MNTKLNSCDIHQETISVVRDQSEVHLHVWFYSHINHDK